ncbi:MAG TPA: gliding motility-associated C-terminal domain-containing protein [Bacteroidia bacterium]|jgi:hypothetical protein|nr:gliding motility-associated C-terminal domain-containing protein [Bacteroidia bacterium]
MRKALYVIFILSYLATKAQPGKEAWHWQFGDNCVLDFSSGAPVTGFCGMHTPEGSASISDPNTGQLLFYTNGVYAENRTNGAMFNALNLGDQNSTQSALIIPKPGSKTVYYIISTDYNSGPYGVRYSVVDMSLRGGLGEVTLKNQHLMPAPATEKSLGVKHCNGTDYWVLLHPLNSNAFNAYLVTAAGINTTPVVSYAGTVLPIVSHVANATPTNFDFPGCGYLKASPNGKKLAMGSDSDTIPIMEIYDFDNSTGVVSNPITINYSSLHLRGPYGLSFSPDNSKLYAEPHKDSTSWLFQYDMSSNVASTIIASQTLIAKTKGNFLNYDYTGDMAAIQMAPDGKIYIARYNTDTLAVINNPNNAGLACNFNYSGLALTFGTRSQAGLPNFIDANYAGINLNISDVHQCASFSIDTLDAGAGFSSYQWSTGVSTNSIVVNAPGKYWVTVTNEQHCSRTDTVNVFVIKPVKKDTDVCVLYTANATQNAVLTYNWYDNLTNPVRTFTNTGIYWIDVAYVGGCSIRDTFDVTVHPFPIVNLGADTAFCLGNLVLNAFNPSSTYNWNTGQTSSSITVKNAASYWVKVTNQYKCVTYDTLVIHPDSNSFQFIMPNIVTPNGDNLNDEIDFSIYPFADLQLVIYDRWGVKVFESADPNCVWKPTSSYNDGTYFANLQYTVNCGTDTQTKNISKFITLVR